jgi:hypothetical protein
MARDLIVKTILDDSNVKKGFSQIEKKGKGLGGALSKAFTPAAVGMAATAVAAGTIAVALKAVAESLKFAKTAVEAWLTESEAINELNASLQVTNQLTAENSALLQQQASDIQAATKFGNEAVLGYQAQAIALGFLVDETDSVIKAALGLSKLYKLDVNAALLLVTKSVKSDLNALSRYGVEIDKTASQRDQLTQIEEAAAVGYQLLTAETFTVKGATEQVKNAWGDLLEVLGMATGITLPNIVMGLKTSVSIINIWADAITLATMSADSDLGEVEGSFRRSLENIGLLVISFSQLLATAWHDIGVSALIAGEAMAGTIGVFVAGAKVVPFLKGPAQAALNDLTVAAVKLRDARKASDAFYTSVTAGNLQAAIGIAEAAAETEKWFGKFEELRKEIEDAADGVGTIGTNAKTATPEIDLLAASFDGAALAALGFADAIDQLATVEQQRLDAINAIPALAAQAQGALFMEPQDRPSTAPRFGGETDAEFAARMKQRAAGRG